MCMELTLSSQGENRVTVQCDGQQSHAFDVRPLIPNATAADPVPHPLDDPVAYGQRLCAALFPDNTLARQALDAEPERIMLIMTDIAIQSIPWEYAYGPGGFLVCEYPFVRGLPHAQQLEPPTLDRGLHIVAVPSNPLDPDVPMLAIEAEWLRLCEIITEVPKAITLERTRPATLEQLRRLVANQRQRIIHFMGHGAQNEQGALLCFENDYGALEVVTAKEMVRNVRGTVLLVTLNACVSATPGVTPFSNLAAALVQRTVSYALGMQFSIRDDDARAFSRVLKR